MIGAAGIPAGRALSLAAGNPGGPVGVIAGKVPACHGAVSVLRPGAQGAHREEAPQSAVYISGS
jgi:hypothetical protein